MLGHLEDDAILSDEQLAHSINYHKAQMTFHTLRYRALCEIRNRRMDFATTKPQQEQRVGHG